MSYICKSSIIDNALSGITAEWLCKMVMLTSWQYVWHEMMLEINCNCPLHVHTTSRYVTYLPAVSLGRTIFTTYKADFNSKSAGLYRSWVRGFNHLAQSGWSKKWFRRGSLLTWRPFHTVSCALSKLWTALLKFGKYRSANQCKKCLHFICCYTM